VASKPPENRYSWPVPSGVILASQQALMQAAQNFTASDYQGMCPAWGQQTWVPTPCRILMQLVLAQANGALVQQTAYRSDAHLEVRVTQITCLISRTVLEREHSFCGLCAAAGSEQRLYRWLDTLQGAAVVV
jgi:hypothetical protein